MKALFIASPLLSPDGLILPDYRLYLLAKLIKKEGFEVEIFNAGDAKRNEIPPSLTADVAVIWMDSKMDIDFRTFREKCQIRYIILGGEFSANIAESVLNEGLADFIIHGDGEKSLIGILKALRKKNRNMRIVKGISYLSNGKIIRNVDEKPLTDLEMEHLPFPLFEEIPDGLYDAFSLETSRGNPFFNTIETYPYGRVWRYVSPKQIMERAEKLLKLQKKVSHKPIYVIDPYFTASSKRIYDLNKIFPKAKEGFKLAYCARVSDLLQEDLIQYLEPWTHKIFIDVLSGYNRGLINIKTGYTVKIIRDAAENLFKYGLNEKSLFLFTVGFPWEEEKEINKTINFAGNLRADFGVNVSINDKGYF
jgi:anaerobic magnesium-protoporphyrin IX monomethyl ester cyclase